MILFDQTLIIKKTKFVQNYKQIMEDKTLHPEIYTYIDLICKCEYFNAQYIFITFNDVCNNYICILNNLIYQNIPFKIYYHQECFIKKSSTKRYIL